jgi:hypothetical protein
VAAVSLTPADLTPFASIQEAKAQAMIDDALALAARVAPCITEGTFAYDAAAKAILRGAVLRWHEAGSGARSSFQVGAVQEAYDTRQTRRGMFWPSEITELERLCQESQSGAAFSIDTVPYELELHAESCALRLGADYCDCGANYAGFPIFGPEAQPSP